MWANGQRQPWPEHSVGRSLGGSLGRSLGHSLGRSLGRSEAPLLARFLGKFVLDVLPAALASLIGGYLFTQFHFGYSPVSQPLAEQVSPASVEVLALVRDEHAAIVGYLKSQLAAEKNRLAAEDADAARAVEDAKAEKMAAEERAAEEKVAEAAQEKVAQEKVAQESKAPDKASPELNAAEVRLASQAPARHNASLAALKPVLPHAKPTSAVAASGGAPLVIAQAEQNVQPDDTDASAGRLARDPDSLLAKTLDLKDQVVAATRHAVSAIGDVFTSVGEHIGVATPNARQFSSDS
jgi:hypothetical protein